jgi:perosamine synthetase
MTNIQAAIGCAQLENVEWHIEQRKRVASEYYRHFADYENVKLQVDQSWAESVYWMNTLLISNANEQDRDTIIQELMNRGIETRPIFYPMHVLPPYQQLSDMDQFPVANDVYPRGINIPTFATLTSEDIAYISGEIKQVIEKVIVRSC